MKRVIFCWLLIFYFDSHAQVRTFQSCKASDAGRSELDNLCPRLEGVHLASCCPPLQKQPPLQCNYHIVKDRGQPFLANSSYTVCTNGQDVSVPCCAVNYRACYTNPVTLQYIPRLINRSNTCCFENCPPANYWRQPPANPSILASHELSNGSGLAQCTGAVLSECSVGSVENCQASSPCPAPPGGTGGGSGSGSGGGTGGGTSGGSSGGSSGGGGGSGSGSGSSSPPPVTPGGS